MSFLAGAICLCSNKNSTMQTISQLEYTEMSTRVTLSIKFILFVAASMTVMAGAIISPSLAEIAVYFKEHPPILTKLVVTVPALFIALFGFSIGNLSDKIGRKKVLLASLLVYGISGFSGFYAKNIFFLLLGRALLGIGVAGIMSTATALVGDYFEEKERDKFLAAQTAFMALGGVLFASLGGFLADINWRFPFSLYLLAIFLFPFALHSLYESNKSRVEKVSESKAVEKINIPKISFVYSLIFIGQVVFYIVPTQIPFLIKERLQSDNFLIGLALALPNFTTMLSALSYHHIKKFTNFERMFALSFVVMGGGYCIVAVAPSYAFILLGLAIYGLGFGLLFPNSNVWLMHLAPASQKGKVMGGMSSVMFLGQFVSPLVAGILIRYYNLTAVFYFSFVFLTTLSILLFVFNKENKE